MSVGEASGTPPESAAEALARARRHARAAAAESVATLRALLDAAALGATGASGAECLPALAGALDQLRALLDAEGGSDAPLLAAVLEALEGEIARWELRSREDPEARGVLRAFLGLREILWELGVRTPGRPEGETARGRGRPVRRQRRSRVQRVTVEG